MSDWLTPTRPLSIAHRGASAYAPANTLTAFALAANLGADMWEVDLHLTADGKIIAFHDSSFGDGQLISKTSYAEIRALVAPDEIPLFLQIVKLAIERGCGIYADIKDPNAAAPIADLLHQLDFKKAILGSFDTQTVRGLRDANCPYPLAMMVPIGADPFALANDADIIHLCWEKLEQPQDLLDDTFFAHCAKTKQKVVLWHEENPARMAKLRNKPVLGICSNRPELVNPIRFKKKLKIVCHRGANKIAPENTLAAAHACFAAGFSHVEIDVHVTADGQLVVLHDKRLERTTNGTGIVYEQNFSDLRKLSAGAWFSEHYRDEQIPTLDEILELAKLYVSQLYIELKSAPAQLIWDRVTAHNMQEQVFFWSYLTQSLHDMRAISTTAQIMSRRQDFASIDEMLNYLSPALVEYTVNDNWFDFSLLREKNVPIMIAYNGSDRNMLEKIADIAPELVNLDQPFLFAEICYAKEMCIE